MPHPRKKGSKGKKYHGDDPKKKRLDRKRRGAKYEPWER